MKNKFKNIKTMDKEITSMQVGKSKKEYISVGIIDSNRFHNKKDREESLIDSFQSQKINSNSLTKGIRRLEPNTHKQSLISKPIEFEDIKNVDRKNLDINEAKKTVSSNPYHLAHEIMSKFKFILLDEILHVWNSNDGIYMTMEQNNAEKFIRKYSPSVFKKQLNTSKIKEILKWIEAECPAFERSRSQIANQNYIAFNNGVYNLLTDQFEGFDSSLIITHKLSVDYDEYTEISNYFEQFINDITDGDTDFYNQLQELFGYVISEVRNVKTLPILLGPKDSGKSICLKILEALVGEKNCSSVSLAQLHRSEFLSELNTKKLNTCGEISSSMNFSIELLKQLTGGDTLMSRSLYSNPIKFKNTAAMVFAGNSLPSFSNKDSHNALLKRISLFYFSQSIPPEKQDIYLLDKILNNLEYVAKWALEGFFNWRNNNFTFTTTETSNYIIQQLSLVTNSIETFISQYCLIEDGCSIYKEDFIQSYYCYCVDNNIDPQPVKQIDKILIENYSIKRKKARLNGANPKSAYFGIVLNSNIKMEEI